MDQHDAGQWVSLEHLDRVPCNNALLCNFGLKH